MPTLFLGMATLWVSIEVVGRVPLLDVFIALTAVIFLRSAAQRVYWQTCFVDQPPGG